MPRDDWGKARSRDKGNAAARSGEFFRVQKPNRRKKKRPSRKPPKHTRKPPETTQITLPPPQKGYHRHTDGQFIIDYNHPAPALATVRVIMHGPAGTPPWPGF